MGRSLEDLEQARARIEQLEAELEHTQQCLQMLASAASHDLKEPLHVIRLFAQILHAQPSAAEHSRHITVAATRMGAMLHGLFRIASLKPATHDAEVELTLAFERAVQALQADIADREASVVCLESATIPMAPEHLELVLFELIGNGVHHHVGPVPSVEVSASNGAEAIVVTVADRGPGLPADLLRSPRGAGESVSQRWQLFRCGDRSSVRAGVGLALVHRILRAYGGDMEIHERTAGGTSVELLLPAVPSARTRQSIA